MEAIITAILLGIVEGLTEFIPVSSTGHLILASELLGYSAETWATFNVIIQLGAILAVIVLYWRTFWDVMTGLMRSDAASWRFARNILIAFLPSAILGFILIDQIEALLENAWVVAVALIVGGIAILIIERVVKPADTRRACRPCRSAPRSASASSSACRWSRRQPVGRDDHGSAVARRGAATAAEFSFFLAVPTMVGATSLSIVKNREELTSGAVDWSLIAVGFVVSFIVAVVVIKAFIGIVSRYGFGPFAWYRIVAGVAALAWLALR
jgi:undecaprenyl-diphosphatase